jgi:hypothetical protein
MDISNMSPRDALIFGFLVNAGVGFVLGLVPLVAGIIKRRFKYGILGLVCSVIGSALGMIVSVLVCTVFTWLIFRQSSEPAITPADDK